MTARSVEIAARMYYLRMLELFAHVPEAAQFFKSMAQDEAEHARMLETMQLSGQHFALVHENANAFSHTLLLLMMKAGEELTKMPENLEEVFEFSCRLENAEVNDIYLRLTSWGANPGTHEQSNIVAQVDNHIRRLRVLGDALDQQTRLKLKPSCH
jgi:rubrerythrin